MEPVLDAVCAGACCCAWATTVGAAIKIEIAMLQIADVAAARQRKRLLRGMVPPENLDAAAESPGLLRNIQSFRSSRRRLVWARDTGISLERLSFILSM